jgi:hypothetical protein
VNVDKIGARASEFKKGLASLIRPGFFWVLELRPRLHFFSPAGLGGKPWPNWYKEEKATVVDPKLFIGVSGVTPTPVKYSDACR